MNESFEVGDRVRCPSKGLNGAVVEIVHDPNQILAPETTYRVQWDDAPSPEILIRADELIPERPA